MGRGSEGDRRRLCCVFLICKTFESCALCCEIKRAAFAGLDQGGRDDELARLILRTRHGDDNLCHGQGEREQEHEVGASVRGKCALQSPWKQIAGRL